MRKKIRLCLLAALGALALAGCGRETAPAPSSSPVPETVSQTVQTEPQPTAPPDGNPGDVTCKGSYSGETLSGTAARVGDRELTVEALQVWYWSAVADYVRGGDEPQPDLTQGLDTQVCPLDPTVNSWQQYFLRQALNSWHTAQALVLQSESWQMPLDPAYEILEDKHEECLVDIPATRLLYGYERSFHPNTLHQAWLDSLPQRLTEAGGQELAKTAFAVGEKTVLEAAELQNLAYMFFTELTYGLEDWDPEKTDAAPAAAPAGERRVDIRHILLTPEAAQEAQPGKAAVPAETLEQCQARAEKLLAGWRGAWNASEGTFAALAHDESRDTATARDGGLYECLAPGQLPEALDAWCFDPERQPGDTVVLTTQAGVHILYFARVQGVEDIQGAAADWSRRAGELLSQARAEHPMTADYRAITLAQAQGTHSLEELLYPDVAHERYPEVPLYLQQDFGGTMYGSYRLSSHGCGITSLAMVATYMTDKPYTPPLLCSLYGSYCGLHGTDSTIFRREPPEMGFYLISQTGSIQEVQKALEEGYCVISLQHAGYWTRGGHYIVLEKYNEDGTIQVRDSNLYNYKRIPQHKEDKHSWKSIIAACSSFWIFDKKVTSSPICARCGDGETAGLVESYLCGRCRTALARRNAYLAG